MVIDSGRVKTGTKFNIIQNGICRTPYILLHVMFCSDMLSTNITALEFCPLAMLKLSFDFAFTKVCSRTQTEICIDLQNLILQVVYLKMYQG